MNTGKESEDLFYNAMMNEGKGTFIHRLADTNEIKGAFATGFINSNPSDFVLTRNGVMEYAEVKSSSNGKASFSFSQFTPKQNSSMIRQVAAGGRYMVYLHNMVSNIWYIVPATLILETKASGRKSLKWTDIEHLKWDLPTLT
jgi:penicillin-binding protein-related factor A (putative recombinase)